MTPVRTMVVWCLDWPVIAHGIAAEERQCAQQHDARPPN